MNHAKIRFGLIIPSCNVVIEPEFYSLSLRNICFYSTRVLLTKCDKNNLKKMGGFVERAALELSTAKVNTILYACTSGSVVGGLEWESNLVEKIFKISNIETITTAGSVVNAFRYLKISKINVFTPYIEEINKKEKYFLEKHGFEVLNIKGLGLTEAISIADVDASKILEESIKVHQKNTKADGFFISCTNLKTFNIIKKLERIIDIPVITSNSASLWLLLRKMQIHRNINLGRLFK